MTKEQQEILFILKHAKLGGRIMEEDKHGPDSYIIRLYTEPTFLEMFKIKQINETAELEEYEKYQDQGYRPIMIYTIYINCERDE